jgi:carboxypeptidase PM20D1
LRVLSGKVSTNATVQTTTAATVFAGGVRENVLPKSASAQINFRILPGETRESVLARVSEVVDDERVKIEVPTRGFASDPTSPSAAESPGYSSISQAVRNVFGEDVLVAPSLTIAGTDTRHFEGIAKDTFRFLPLTLTQTDTPRIHGVDERVSRDAYAQAIRFYAELLAMNMAQ